MRKELIHLIGAIFCLFFGLTFLTIVSCGGGGGDGGSSIPPTPTTDYSGNWLVEASLTYWRCQLLPNQNITVTLKVSQSGNNVTVVGVDKDTGTYTGTTNDDDGFDVYHSIKTSSGTINSAYTFEDASDGNAKVIYTIDFPPATSCNLGYTGTAVRQSSDTAITIETESNSSLNWRNNFFQKMLEKNLDTSKESLP